MPTSRPRMKVTLLGTGTSTGIPVIGCSCRVCRSTDPRDQRTRCACHIDIDGLSLVIDTGPDFRHQALRETFEHIDAVLYTHHHFDHVVGIDDLRPFLFGNRTPIPCYAHPETANLMRRMFHYIFSDGTYPGVPKLDLFDITEPFDVVSRHGSDQRVRVEPIEVFHGTLPMYGFRMGRFAYLTDTSHIPETSYAYLQDLDVLVLDALRHEPHSTHFTIEQSIAEAQRIGARQTYFIHMTHSILHAEEDARLPEGIALGYDGLSFEID